jgi:hypothetical protein
MSFYRADLCPLELLLTQICILPNRFSLRSVSFTLAEEWCHNNWQLITSLEAGIWKDGGTGQYTRYQIQDISWYQMGINQWVSQMWILPLIAISFFLSVQNVEDTDLWGYFFWHIILICVLCQRTQIWGNIYFGGNRSEEICFWKDIDLGVTSEDTDLRRQGFGRTWIWVWRNDWTRIWSRTWIRVLHIYSRTCLIRHTNARDQVIVSEYWI